MSNLTTLISKIEKNGFKIEKSPEKETFLIELYDN